LLLIIANQARSQELIIGFQTGKGTYSMSGLNDLNSAISKSLPFNTKLVSDFPSYWSYRPTFLMKFNHFSIGLSYTYQSTGSRISVKDYSGEYRFDMNINSSSPGIYGVADIVTFIGVQLSFYSMIEKSYTNLKMNEYFNVSDSLLTNQQYKFKATSYSFEPGIRISYPISFINIGINAGYSFQIGAKGFYSIENKNNILVSSTSNLPITPNWNGFRMGFSVSYKINKKALFRKNKSGEPNRNI
jgi:hypothetical protein